MAQTTYPLNRDQERAFNKILRFLSPQQLDDLVFVLSGYAGTGKTYLLNAIHHHRRHGRAIFVGPTNKSTKVLKRLLERSGWTVECKTIYSFLGIKMVSDEDRMVLQFPAMPVNISGYDVVFADEGSMYNYELTEYIAQLTRLFKTKWVISGDRAQLPPVGERISPIWKLNCPKARLTMVERYDNEILELATHIRDNINSFPKIDLCVGSNHTATQGVWKFRREAFFRNIQRYADNGEFINADDTCAVAWRNKTVTDLNQIIRRAMFGSQADKHRWVVGDRLSVGEPISIEGKVVAHIEDEGTVVSQEIVHHSLYKDFNIYFLTVQMDDGPVIQFNVIHEDSEGALNFQLDKLAVEAKADRSKWKYFWMMRNSFHRVRHGFAKTSHRVQGSTYRNVFLDTADIMANSDTLEALRCFYVGATRPTDKLILT